MSFSDNDNRRGTLEPTTRADQAVVNPARCRDRPGVSPARRASVAGTSGTVLESTPVDRPAYFGDYDALAVIDKAAVGRQRLESNAVAL
jgi:hypothetical protein